MSAEIVIVLVAVTLAYFVKGITGMGGPLLAIPIIAVSTSVEHAVVVVSFANLVANGYLLWEHRASAGGIRWFLVPLVAAGTIGTIVGSWLLTELDDRILSIVLAVLIFAYIVRFVTKPDVQLPTALGRKLAAPVGMAGGLMSGGTGIGGPLFATYLHSLRIERSSFVFTMSLLFQIFGPIQMIVLASLGSFTAERTLQALVAVVPVLIVSPPGVALSRRLPQRWFEMAVLALIGFSAIRLVTGALG